MKILLSLLLLYFIIGEPWLERKDHVRFARNLSLKKQSARIVFYSSAFMRNWLMCGYILIVLFSNGISLTQLGFTSITIQQYLSYSYIVKLLIILSFLFYCIYFYLFPFVLVHFNDKIRAIVLKVLTSAIHIMPQRKVEYLWWIINSLNASIEELIYRGFVFFFIPYLIPNISILLVFFISIFLDAIRYFPRISAMKHVALSGIIFALSYIIFKSIYISIMLHVIQDLTCIFAPFYLVSTEPQKGASV